MFNTDAILIRKQFLRVVFIFMGELFINPEPSLVFLLMLLHCLIGLNAAIVADQKGYLFTFWLIIGLIGGTIGLIAALFLSSKHDR